MAKKIIYFVWIVVILSLLIFFLIRPDLFTPENIADLLANNGSGMLIIYSLLSFTRGLFLIPSTPFVFTGIILFPNQPWTIILISMIGIVIGSTAVYYFSDLLGFSEKLERKYPKKIERWHRRLNSPKSTLIVIAWSFFPFVPTDVICYVAGIVKMPYKYMILGVVIGEMVLVSIYVCTGAGILEYLIG